MRDNPKRTRAMRSGWSTKRQVSDEMVLALSAYAMACQFAFASHDRHVQLAEPGACVGVSCTVPSASGRATFAGASFSSVPSCGSSAEGSCRRG